MMQRAVTILALAAFLAGSSVWAQQRPTLGYVYPGGAPAGRSVEIRLGGYDLTPDVEVFVHDDRVKLELLSEPGPLIFPGAPYWFGPRALNSYKPFPIPREIKARLTIPENMPPGPIRWQVANANGASELAEFVIGGDTPEVIEDDLERSNGALKLPPLPLILNGRLENKEEVDRYHFVARHTGLITIEMANAQIGSRIDAAIRVVDDSGRTVADYADTVGQRAAVTFKVVEGTNYTLDFNDLDYRGNRAMVYRLSLRRGPRVVAMIPTCLPPDSETAVTLIGYGIASGQPQLEKLSRKIKSKGTSFDYQLETAHGFAGSIPVKVSQFVETVIAQHAHQQPTELEMPGCVCSVFDDPRGYQLYRFHGNKGDVWSIDVSAPALGPELDVMFSVVGPDGKVIINVDDAGGTMGARGMLNTPADGEYYLLVADQSSSRGRVDAVYRLCISEPNPSFRMTAPARVETFIGAEPITPAKRRRAGRQQTGAIGIDIERIDGFAGEISLQVLSLPAGVHVPEQIKIDTKQQGVDIPVSCDANVTPDARMLVVKATAHVNENVVITREASVLLSPMLQPRTVLRPKYPDAARTVNRGTTYPAPVVIERLEQYEGPVELQMAAVPDRVRQGILGHSHVIPAEQNEGVFPLVIPEWVQTDRTSRIILNALVTVPDAAGRMRTLVSRMQQRITMNVEGALLKVSTAGRYHRWNGDSVDIPVELFRSGKLGGPVTVTVDGPDQDRGSPPLEPISLSPDQRSAVLTVKRGPANREKSEYTVRATAQHLGYPVVSETQIVVATPTLSAVSLVPEPGSTLDAR